MRAILAAIGIALLALWLAGLAAGRTDAPATPAATGDPTYTSGTFTLRLSNEPCDLEEQAAELNDRGIPPGEEDDSHNVASGVTFTGSACALEGVHAAPSLVLRLASSSA